jgi:hypothetical protein
MNQSIISYTFKGGDRDAWHREVAAFIGQLNTDSYLKGRIAYRCLREKNGDRYFHLATAVDSEAVKALQSKPFFRAYQEATRRAGGGEVDVIGLESVAETNFRG